MELASDITPKDIEMFLQETDEQLLLLDQDFVRLETEEDNEDLLQEIFRAAHTIKGSAAMIGHNTMSELAHAMENVLDELRKGALSVTPHVIDALLNSLDILKVLKDELLSSEESGIDISAAVAELSGVNEESNRSPTQVKSPETKISILALNPDSREKLQRALAAGNNSFKIKADIDSKSSWPAVRCFQVFNELSTAGDIINSIPSQQEIDQEKVDYHLEVLLTSPKDMNEIKSVIESVPELVNIDISFCSLEETTTVVEKEESADKIVARKTNKMGQTVRVDVTRMDSLMEQVGELVINRNRINQISKMLEGKYRGDELIFDLGKTATQVGIIVNTLQQDIMKIRMLPIDVVVNGFPRMVRDLARKSNKNIEFTIAGQDTEVDRSIIENLRDPLVHLLRNAVDHGIESPKERKSTEKPETAFIRLSAFHEQNHLVITVEDDGKGLNPQAIKESAIKKGFIKSEVADGLTDSEAIDLIFASGLSTAKKTTDISGRGVGLDVVKTNIESINGSISIESKLGKGTKFKLMLPLTLTILPSLLTSIDNVICAIPLANIVETAILEPKDIQTIQGKEVTTLRGRILPLVRLTTVFDWGSERTANIDVISVAVVKYAEKKIGLIVDELIEEQEIVVKSIGKLVGGSNGIAGASILGDGRLALILDVATLIELITAEHQNQGKKENVYLAA